MLFGDEHVRRYRQTGGEEGYEWQRGTTILLLRTRGRRSGQMRTTPLIFRPHGDGWMIVASKGGTPEPPAWYLNLLSDPNVQVQVRGDVFRAHARDATAEEQPRLWREMTEIWPDYDVYQQKTERKIPVVVLERA